MTWRKKWFWFVFFREISQEYPVKELHQAKRQQYNFLCWSLCWEGRVWCYGVLREESWPSARRCRQYVTSIRKLCCQVSFPDSSNKNR